MGHAFSSKPDSSQKTPSSTPQRSTNAPTCVDPRSPSQDIERTPIQINNSTDTRKSDSTENDLKKDEKPRQQSLRQKMFARKKNNSNEVSTEE